jgi:hypothetical protein
MASIRPCRRHRGAPFSPLRRTRGRAELKPKAALMAAVPQARRLCRGGARARPELHPRPRNATRRSRRTAPRAPRTATSATANSGNIVFKPVRQFMPDLPGMRPENISVKRDRIVFRYSF